ncbi:MAG: Crp/Fnr family transcriptional regulator [Flavobacteriales bacterium]|nr:Crp/Fnr family transcriptional regulator [Flavobacteriales bacterium]
MTNKAEIPNCEDCKTRGKSIFCDLKSDELADLSYNKGCSSYKKGQVIFYEGRRPTGLYCINKGKVKIAKLGEEGKEQIVRLAREGDILGYRSLIGGDAYSASAETLEETSVCFIPKEAIFNLIRQSPEFSIKIIELVSKDLKSAENKVTDLAQKHVRERVAEALLMLKETYGLEDDEQTLGVALTREVLANIVGTATETVIRLLSELKKDEIIALEGRKIKILNHKQLIRTASIYD